MELDEIFRAFDKQTREGFQVWQQDLGKGIEGQGAGFSEFLGVLPAFAQDTNKVLEILNSQERATREAIKNTGVVFDALTERGDQLSQWIEQLQRPAAHHGPARRPASAPCSRRSRRSSTSPTRPCRRWEPTPRTPSRSCAHLTARRHPALQRPGAAQARSRPTSTQFFIGLNRVIPASVKGLPASSRFLDDTRNLFVQLDPVLRNFNPFFEYLALFKREIAAMLANDTAVTQATDQIGEDRYHYLRLTSPVNPEAVATYPQRQGWHRGNPYLKPGSSTRSRAACRCSTRTCASRTASRRSVPPRPACPRSCATASCCTC